jgi:hypothetical protein
MRAVSDRPFDTPPSDPLSPPTGIPDTPYSTSGSTSVSTEDVGTGERSKTDEVREQGRQVTDTAKGEARSVAGTAKEQAGRVAQEAKAQGRNLLTEARGQIKGQAQSQTGRAADYTRGLAEQFRALSEGRTEEAGPIADYARQATQQIEQFADRIGERGFDGLVQDVQSFARRRPGAFLVGAAVAGFLTGRLVRGARDAQSDGGSSYRSTTGYDTGYSTGYSSTTGYGQSTDPFSTPARSGQETAPLSSTTAEVTTPSTTTGTGGFADPDDESLSSPRIGREGL